MTKIDIVSGFLGAGKTTLIQKLLKEALDGNKTVLIENEFGEIGIDGGFLKESGVRMQEMNSGCICCSLVGDFGTSLQEVLTTYKPERILIEPSGVGKLSDVIRAVADVETEEEVSLSSAVVVVDASKCKMYAKNFGEFFINQIEAAGLIVLSRTGNMSTEKIEAAVAVVREHNPKATVITTPWDTLDGKQILTAMEKKTDWTQELMDEIMAAHAGHEEEETCECGHHYHHEEGHHHHDHEGHHHHDHEDHHDHDHEEHHHHHDHDHEEHHHHHDEHCECGCGHHHHHGHDAEEIFTSWGKETPAIYTRGEIEDALKALDAGEYGIILRAKGMLPDGTGAWTYFDFVPGEIDVREGRAELTGKICVIGSELKEEKLAELFGK